MNSDDYRWSTFYLGDYNDRFWYNPISGLAGTFSLSSLTPVSYEEAYGIPTHTASGEDKGYTACYEGKPTHYFPRKRELKIEGMSVTVPEEFVDYIRLREFLESPTDGTECDDEPIDLREFLA